VFFIDKDSAENKTGKNVFIASHEYGKQAMTSARNGHIEQIDDDRFLVLQTGQRVEQTVGESQIKISEFKTYGTRISNDVKAATLPPPKSVHTHLLLLQPTPQNLGELTWRLGLSIAAFNLVLLALAITSANPRVGRGGNFALALFIFVIYYNFINLGQSWIGSGKVALWPFMLALHAGALTLALLWLSVRHNQWTWRHLFKPTPDKEQLA